MFSNQKCHSIVLVGDFHTSSTLVMLLFISFCLIILGGCANPSMPEGGPRDTTPPVILEYEPADKTINFSDNSVTVEFDDYMNRQSVIQNLYITPEIKTEYDWSGKELEIGFLDPLKTNTTYAVTLDGNYTDRFGNKPQNPFTIIFSTGADLDSASISGKVQGSGETLYAMLWKKDSLGTYPNITEIAADYKLKISSNNTFSFKGLAEGEYRIAAVDDRFQDGIVDFNSDGFSASKSDIELADGESRTGIEMFIGPAVDTAAPSLISAYYRNRVLFSMRTSESVIPNDITASSLIVTDSTGSSLQTTALYLDTLQTDLLLVSTAEMQAGMKYSIVIGESENPIADSTGNTIWAYNDTLSFVTPDEFEEFDIPILRLTSISVTDSMKGFDYRDTISFSTNYPIVDEGIKSGFQLMEVGKVKKIGKIASDTLNLVDSNSIDQAPSKVDFRIAREGGTTYSILTQLEPRTEYILEYDTTLVRIPLANEQYSRDSLLSTSYFFSTGFKPDFSEVSGEFRVETECKGEIVVIAFMGEEEVTRWVISKTQSFGPIMLEPGNYTFQAFCDENGNGKRDYGYPSPFRFAETEYLISNKLLVKPKWDVVDFIVNIKGFSDSEKINKIKPVIPLGEEPKTIPKK